jgi:endonuclease I
MGAELKTALHDIVKNHTTLNYGSLWTIFRETDALPNDRVWDMYSNIERYYYQGASGLNREHSFPVSWWGGSHNLPIYTDINHIFPSDAVANNAKSNYPLGVVSGTVFFDNGVTKVGNASYSGYSGRVFEPADQYKGDFARAYLYVVTRYEDYFSLWRYNWMLQNNTYPVFNDWSVNLLLEWHRNDPVSVKEIERNRAVFNNQYNRNPFIDYPELVEHIWGNKMNEPFMIEDFGNTDPVLTTPPKDTKLDFGTAVMGHGSEMDLHLKGSNLYGSNITVGLFGGNADQFSVSAVSIPFEQVNTGYLLKVKYLPTVVSDLHQTLLFIQGGGIIGSVGVSISGKSIHPSSVTPPVALPATNISATGFRANWVRTESSTYFLEVFENGLLVGNYDDIETCDDNTCYYYVTGLEKGKKYRYTVKREISGYMSAPSNVIEVTTTTSIDNMRQMNNINFYSQKGKIMFLNSGDITQLVEIYDIAGRLIRKIELSPGETQVVVPASGVYIIRSNGFFERVIIE